MALDSERDEISVIHSRFSLLSKRGWAELKNATFSAFLHFKNSKNICAIILKEIKNHSKLA
jgi:hypothetical protein